MGALSGPLQPRARRSSVPAVKDGLCQFLATTSGLTEADTVRVHSAPPSPEDAVGRYLVLGEVRVTVTPAGLQGRAEAGTMTLWIHAVVAGAGAAAIQKARDEAYELLGLLEDAIWQDPSAAGTVPAPGQLKVGGHTLEEATADQDGTAGRAAQLIVQLTWTSHLT